MRPHPLLLVAIAALSLPLVALRAAPRPATASRPPVTDPHGGKQPDCAKCHNAESWTITKLPGFSHAATGFRLEGAHAKVSCRECHRTLVFAQVGTACVDCHRDTHQGQLGFNCETCHTPQGWAASRQTMSNVHSRTRFPLTGRHAAVDCEACHRGQVAARYATTPTECGKCHLQSYLSARSPVHSTGGFSQSCESCHTSFGWRPATGIDHSRTRFPLTGGHAALACARCHVGGRTTGTPVDCWSCHQARYTATSNPNHVASGFPRTCDSCHSTTAWRPAAAVDHSKTRFPLTGAHLGVDCARCHVGGRFTGTPTDCWSCHQASFNGTRNPNHAGAGFARTCESCHTTTAWRPANFDHSRTAFPLTGGHTRVDCTRCHTGGRYKGTPTDCWSCHQANYNGTSNPNHASAGFPKTCESCHTSNAWKPANFDHSRTAFPLTGGHTRVDCTRCHTGGRYKGTPTDCWSCHQANYNGTSNPNHASAGFPKTCESCHTTNAWKPANFDHSRTAFPLTGGHRSVDCTRCHTGGRYAGTPTDCWSCHQAIYNGTSNPNHASAGFPKTCESCHTTNAWKPANFDHNRTAFPLTGGHRSVDCTRCHTGGRYAGTPTDCWSCHQANYNGTSNPNHRTAGFPTTCQQCHTTNAWRPASFDHDGAYFPIYSGKHRGKWSSCQDCHVSSNNYRAFECINCHEHNRADMDSKHRGVGGYQYSSASCYRCHPRGSGGFR